MNKPETNQNTRWKQFNEQRKTNGLSPLTFEDWFTQHYRNMSHVNVTEIIKYLDLDIDNPNIGTKNKQRLMERALTYMKHWRIGTYTEWRDRLSLRLNVTVRTVRENYLDPLITEGIIKRTGSYVTFQGMPQDCDE